MQSYANLEKTNTTKCYVKYYANLQCEDITSKC